MRNIFISFGAILSVKIPLDYQTNKHRGFAFVEFQEHSDANEAIFNMNDSEILGSHIKVNFSMPDRAKNSFKPGNFFCLQQFIIV